MSLVWLASFPKSGNTWMRAFLAHYRQSDAPRWGEWDTLHAADLRMFYEGLGVEATDLTVEEVANARPSLYRIVAATAPPQMLVKVHDAWGRTPQGELLFPPEVTTAAVYLVRHPCAVAVSWAHHAAVSLDQAVAFVCGPQSRLEPRRQAAGRQLPQYLGSWAAHVSGWMSSGLPGAVVRYEDLLATPTTAFRRVVEALQLPVESSRFFNALAATQLEVLQGQEAQYGFRERPARVARFFREGRVDGWREVLSPAQCRTIEDSAGEVMQAFGYTIDDPDAGMEIQR